VNSLHDLAVLFEHPEWQKPLFAALDRRGVDYLPIDIKRAAFAEDSAPLARLYFNQASPSAYVRGNVRAVPYVLAQMRHLESAGSRVLNGSGAFELELSKTAQAGLLRRLGIDHPRSITFNSVDALRDRLDLPWPAMLKPEQGGSGARMNVVNSLDELEGLLSDQPGLWLPDNLLLLQEYLAHDPEVGVVRLEFLGGELLYAMRVISHGQFNLCPSVVCNPLDGLPIEVQRDAAAPVLPVEFHAFPEVPGEASTWEGSSTSKRLTAAGSSTTSTPTPTCANRWRGSTGVSTRSTAWWTTWWASSAPDLSWCRVRVGRSRSGTPPLPRDVRPSDS